MLKLTAPLCFTFMVLVTAGCTALSGNGAKRKASDLAAHVAKTPATWAAMGKVSSSAATGWLSDFDSAALKRLVGQAVAANHDLREVEAKVRQAQALVRVAGAALLPKLDADFGSSRSQQPSGKRFEGVGQRSNRFETGLNIAWELDFWGRLRDQRGVVVADAEAQAEDLHAARLSLAATVAKTAIGLAEAEAAARLAADDVKTQRTQLDVLNKQLDRGLNAERGALDVSLSQADLARAEATQQARQRETDGLRRALEALLGAYPAGAEVGIGALPAVSRSVPVGLPSELLLRRPDLRAAERRLESAVRDESVAKKAFLPSFKLTSNGGFSTQELAQLLTHDSLAWSLAGSVAQSLFSGGKLKANVVAARARYDQALERYAQTALEAFTDVETALAAERYWLAQEAALERAATEAERAEGLARTTYDRGLADILTLLDSRNRAFAARSALLAAQASRLKNRVDLYLALGGGF